MTNKSVLGYKYIAYSAERRFLWTGKLSPKKLGNNIKKYRLEKGFSQENLALRAGIHPAYLGRLERGEKCPTLDTVFKICEALSVPVADIISFAESESKHDGDTKTVEEIIEKLPKSKQVKLLDIIKSIAELI